MALFFARKWFSSCFGRQILRGWAGCSPLRLWSMCFNSLLPLKAESGFWPGIRLKVDFRGYNSRLRLNHETGCLTRGLSLTGEWNPLFQIKQHTIVDEFRPRAGFFYALDTALEAVWSLQPRKTALVNSRNINLFVERVALHSISASRKQKPSDWR